jgi:FkbM family methyltransferase
MLKIYTNTIKIERIIDAFDNHPNRNINLYGNEDIKYKPITVFVDYIPDERLANMNEYNILLYTGRNKNLTPSNINTFSYLFSVIVTDVKEILNTCDHVCFIDCTEDDDTIMKNMRNLIVQLVEINNITDDLFSSQEGEDKWIVNNLKLPDTGFFLDIGACYAVVISNTYHFEKHKNWSGIAIEPDPVYYEEFTKTRKCIVENVAIHPTEKEVWFKEKSHIESGGEFGDFMVKCDRLDNILEKHNIKKIDLISIDVEGFEKLVWSSFDYKKYSPEIIIVEHTEMGKYDPSFAEQLLLDSDYEIVHVTPLNFIIAKKGLRK